MGPSYITRGEQRENLSSSVAMNIKGNWGIKTILINIYEPRQKVVEIKRETRKQKRRETDEIAGRQKSYFPSVLTTVAEAETMRTKHRGSYYILQH